MTTKKSSSVPVPGSERPAVRNARRVGAAPADQRLQVTVVLRRRLHPANAPMGAGNGASAVNPASTGAGRSNGSGTATSEALTTHLMQASSGPLTPLEASEFAARFGADPADIEQVEAFAHEHGLDVVDIKPAERRIVLTGSVAALSTAFGVTLETYATTTPDPAAGAPVAPAASDAAGATGAAGAAGAACAADASPSVGAAAPGASPSAGNAAPQPPASTAPAASVTGPATFLGRSGAVHVPASLAGIVEGVFGLDSRPQARPHFRLKQSTPTTSSSVVAHAGSVSYTPPQLAKAYEFPSTGKGHGQCVAIIELGGGYKAAELAAYFTGLGLTPPKVKSKSVDGGHNSPSGDANSADGEVLLDIEVVGAVAPAATIVVYFAPNTDAGFLNAISTAIHDPSNRPSVVSISWGGPETSWTAQAMQAMDSTFQDAAALGVTVCCAAGDDGSSDQRTPGADGPVFNADFPASSPFALACGGTRLQSSASPRQETVWNDGRGGGATGGGISAVFPLPAWQQAAHVPPSANPGNHVGRGLPDVAANADPATGYQILVDGQNIVIGGTSAVAPLYAGLVALCNEQLGRRIGYLNPLLYKLPATAQAFNDIRVGDNDISGGHGPYPAGAGWDACTGLGSVRGSNLLAALRSS